MGCRNDSKFRIMEVKENLYDILCPGRLCLTGISKPNARYKTGTSIQETESKD